MLVFYLHPAPRPIKAEAAAQNDVRMIANIAREMATSLDLRWKIGFLDIQVNPSYTRKGFFLLDQLSCSLVRHLEGVTLGMFIFPQQSEGGAKRACAKQRASGDQTSLLYSGDQSATCFPLSHLVFE